MEENLTHAARECGVVWINNPSMLWNWRLSHFCRGCVKKWLSQSRTRKEKSRREQVVWNEVLLWKESWNKKIGFFKESPDLKVTVQKIINTTKKNWGTEGDYRPADLLPKWMHFYLQNAKFFVFVLNLFIWKKRADLTKRLAIAGPRPTKQQLWKLTISFLDPILSLAFGLVVIWLTLPNPTNHYVLGWGCWNNYLLIKPFNHWSSPSSLFCYSLPSPELINTLLVPNS